MNARIAARHIDGTSALKIGQIEASGAGAKVIPFSACAKNSRAADSPVHDEAMRHAAREARLPKFLASSEMFCSLYLEDFRGCAYNVFTRRGTAMLSAAIAVISVAAIIIGG